MQDQFIGVIREKNLFQPEDRLLVAVSGGVDSMVLAHLLKNLKFDFAVAHVQFQLRGEDSRADEMLVREYCKKWAIPFYCKSFDTKKYATERKVSIQMAARDLRYAWFNELAEVEGFTKILTAHHLDDVLETIILNLARGTGLSGIAPIISIEGNLCRPLLDFSKDEIVGYAKEQEVSWREDKSNLSPDYLRNKVRHEMIPVLKQINPGLIPTFRASYKRLEYGVSYYKDHLKSVSTTLAKKSGSGLMIDLKQLHQYPDPAVILWEVIKDYGFNFSQAMDIAGSYPGGRPGSTYYAHGFRLIRDRETLLLEPWKEGKMVSEEWRVTRRDQTLNTPLFDFSWEQVAYNQSGLSEHTEQEAMLDGELVSFPLTIRKWAPGDKFVPLGMKGKKKLSDFMIDQKIPLNLKERVFVVISNNEIIWVPGHRIDDRFKVTSKTKKLLRLIFDSGHD